MDAFTNSTTQATLTNLVAQLNLLTNQLHNIQIHDAKFEANDVQVYLILCRYGNGPHMSIDCQMEDPFAQDHPPPLPEEETLSIAKMANTHTLYMANAFMDERSQATLEENLSIAKMASENFSQANTHTRFIDDDKKKANKLLLEEQ